jgi:hypothetical protein
VIAPISWAHALASLYPDLFTQPLANLVLVWFRPQKRRDALPIFSSLISEMPGFGLARFHIAAVKPR